MLSKIGEQKVKVIAIVIAICFIIKKLNLMAFLPYIAFAIFIFGSWHFSKQYINYGKGKGLCIAGLIFCLISIWVSVLSIKDCFYAFSVVDKVERGIGSDMYYAFSSSIYGPAEVWTQAFFQMIITIPWGVLSAVAASKYYKAIITKRNEFDK